MLKDLIDRSVDGTAYYDMEHSRREGCPRAALNIPLRNYWYNDYNMALMSYGAKREVGIVPTALRSFDASEAEPVPGDAGYMRYRNHLIYLPESDDDVPCEDLRYTFDDGHVSTMPEEYTYRFVNDDGLTLYYHKAWKIIPDRIARIDVVR